MNNTGITLIDVRSEAMSAIAALKSGGMDVKTAAEIRNLLNTVIDTAKCQVEFIKALPETVKQQMTPVEVKAIAGTLKDRDAEIEPVLHQIEENRKKPYK